MTALTALCIAGLAWMSRATRQRVESNAELMEMQSMMYAFDRLPAGIREESMPSSVTTAEIPWDPAVLKEDFRMSVQRIDLPVSAAQKDMLAGSHLTVGDSVAVYRCSNPDAPESAFGFFMKGKGLWGTITAFAAVSEDFSRMIGIDFTEQVETPGLGARILEKDFKYYFRNLDISGIGKAGTGQGEVVMSRKMDATNVQIPTHTFQAITGATQTCGGVLKMINTDIRFYREVVESAARAGLL
jgi:Na+-translocating ferredoxin:NAD+ oxidoreductase RnfG subunit